MIHHTEWSLSETDNAHVNPGHWERAKHPGDQHTVQIHQFRVTVKPIIRTMASTQWISSIAQSLVSFHSSLTFHNKSFQRDSDQI
jgi:hypothetical protein